MLVLSRKVGEKIVIGDNVTVVINRVVGNRVSVGIEAPADVRIVRGELAPIVTAFESTEEQDIDCETTVNVAPTFDLPTPSVVRAR